MGCDAYFFVGKEKYLKFVCYSCGQEVWPETIDKHNPDCRADLSGEEVYRVNFRSKGFEIR